MGKYATGNKSQAISDRSGQAFPYNEMVKEWNGSLVHISEFEPKHPQIQRRYNTADAIACDLFPVAYFPILTYRWIKSLWSYKCRSSLAILI